MKKYETLKTQYPAYVSLEQLYKICKIAKRSARYLVANDIIPSIDTGRKTWRYKIAIEDVIAYLRRREQWGSMIPPGAVSPHNAKRRRSFSQAIAPGQEQEVAKYFERIYAGYPDAMTVHDIAQLTGLSQKSFSRIISAGHIKVLARHPRCIIPKAYFLEFAASRRFIDMRSNSESFIKVLEAFEAWKAEK